MRLKNRISKIPLFFLLLMFFAIGHPVRAEAETVLDEDMTSFVTIGDYTIIQTDGEALNRMFGCKLENGEQYIAYYKIDTTKDKTTNKTTKQNTTKEKHSFGEDKVTIANPVLDGADDNGLISIKTDKMRSRDRIFVDI